MAIFVIVLIVGSMLIVFNLLLVANKCQQDCLAEFRSLFGPPDSDSAKQAFFNTFGVAWNAPQAAYAVKRHIHEISVGTDKSRDITLARGYGYRTAYWY